MYTRREATVASTLTSPDAVECTFDAEGTAHLMSVLSNMYADAPAAVLREYAANARDAHIAAGNPDPIRITLPTEWDPTLTIADHGTGLNRDEIINVYSRYGKSTKRDTDEQVGAFGIGAKSAFTIATQFAVTGVKEGWRTSALFALNEDSVGTVDIREHTPTDEPTGVTISVAVDDPNAVRTAAQSLFATWEPGTILLDGEHPDYLLDDMFAITDTLYARRSSSEHPAHRNGITIVMGGIPYSASHAMLMTAARQCDNADITRLLHDVGDRHNPFGLLVLAPVGSVDITPSREDLRDTPRTIDCLIQAAADYHANVDTAISRVIDSEPSATHAAISLCRYRAYLPRTPSRGVHWRGRLLSPRLTVPYGVIRLDSSHNARRRTTTDPQLDLHLGQDDLAHMLVVTGITQSNETSVRRLASRYLAHYNLRTLVLSPDDSATVGWFSFGDDAPVASLTADEFREQSKALPSAHTRRSETTYRITTPDGQSATITATDLRTRAQRGQVIVASTTRWQRDRPHVLASLDAADVLVTLTGNQTLRGLQRRVPSARDLDNHTEQYARHLLHTASAAEHRAIRFVVDDWTERIAAIPRLRDLEPIREHVRQYRALREERAALAPNRRDRLRWAAAALGVMPAPLEQPDLSDMPLLEVLLGALRWVEPTDALVADVQRYLSAAQATDVPAVAA